MATTTFYDMTSVRLKGLSFDRRMFAIVPIFSWLMKFHQNPTTFHCNLVKDYHDGDCPPS